MVAVGFSPRRVQPTRAKARGYNLSLTLQHMAHKKAAGSTDLGRDSESKRLGVKISDGQATKAGQIIVRQRGTKIHPGSNVRIGKDDTLYAAITGIVKFSKKQVRNFTGALKKRTFARVENAK